MHDPNVVAHEIPSPIPRRVKYQDNRPDAPRWGFRVARGTGTKNKGKRVYRWWRPKGYTLYLAGKAWGLHRFMTIWHVEPGGRDAFEVCKHRRQKRDGTWVYNRRWAWHFWHWHLQIHALQNWRRRLFDRCAECGRKGSPNVSHGWNRPGRKHWWWGWWRSVEGVYHGQCSALISYRQTSEQQKALIRLLAAQLRVETDESEVELIKRLYDRGRPGDNFTENFNLVYQLQRILGYERDPASQELVKKEPVST